MADLTQLRAALAERYEVMGVLGEGGMATVYRATDLKLGREVAIKVLRQVLSESIGAQRFVNEIQIAATLQHPRILALYDSGEAAGFLYYVMPLVEGESLHARLDREKQLPIEDAIRITRDVANALAYAHARGIVHRDIKPGNILLHGGEAIVADFGIALALKKAGGDRLTMTGISIGTPAYMTLEQASGEAAIDARSDVYSLGCVLYEMIAGIPPFSGRTMESVVRQHVAAPVPRISVMRPNVTPALEETIERALAKAPADRFRSVSEFLAALDAPATGTRSRAREDAPRRQLTRRLGIAIVAGIALAVASAAGWLVFKRATRIVPDESLIAVLPFEVSGDSSAQFLREGMVDLLTTQLGSLSGSRPLDSRTVLSAWGRAVPEGEEPSTSEKRRLAASMGSRWYVQGRVIEVGAELSITASIVDVVTDSAINGSAQGPRDSLFSLVDRLTSQLIAGSVNEPARRLQDLMSVSLAAVRAYLDGRAALRAGALERARARFTAALEFDSTFALAALGMASSGVWPQQAGQSAALSRGLRTGYALRERLSRRDQLLFEAWVRPTTEPGHSVRDQVTGWERAVESAPESPEALYELADRLYHQGEQIGIVDAQVRAESLFARALALDSAFAPPLAHLVELAVRSNDRRAVRRLAALSRVESSTADAGDYVRWRVALVNRDRRMLDTLRGRRGTMPQAAINRIIGFGLTDGVELADVDSAAAELRRRVDAGTTTPNNVPPGQSLHNWALNRGRTAEVARAIATIAATEPAAGASIVFFGADQLPILDAMFWDGDSVAAVSAAERLEQRVSGARPANSGQAARYNTNLCVLALWRQATGDTAAQARLVERLRAGTATRDPAAVHGAAPELCLSAIDALDMTQRRLPDAQRQIARLDSILSSGPYVFGNDWANLALARAYETSGDQAGALRAVGRRQYDWDTGPLYLSTYLREEGRLAAATGDAGRARLAYERYLALRAGADGGYQAKVDEVRRAVAALK